MPEYLTQQQIDQFHQNGYLLVPEFLRAEETHRLLRRAKELLEEFSLDDHPLTKFTTSDKDHVGDDYFLNSGDKIKLQASLPSASDRHLSSLYYKALHELDPVFRKVTLENERLRALVRDLKFHQDPVALQSMVITKQPQIGGAGSHLTTPITKRFVRLPQGGTGFEPLVPSTFEIPKQTGKYVLEACNAGDLVLIHGSILHKSERNTSPHTRFAYTFHMIDSPPHALYDNKNWLQPTLEMPFSHILETPNIVVDA
ncbi:hypothetical protein H0H93_013314 [Arthromyces matolae]|nr:hypothetical protein H0H93_013314 [Arthromyces matolae]